MALGADMNFRPEYFDFLVCPVCKDKVKLTDDRDGLICKSCHLLYEIRDGVPVMLIEEAKSWP